MSIPPELRDLSGACHASRLNELWHIPLPCVVLFIFAGLEVAISLAFVGAPWWHGRHEGDK